RAGLHGRRKLTASPRGMKVGAESGSPFAPSRATIAHRGECPRHRKGGTAMLGFLKGRPEHPRLSEIRQLHLFATLSPRELRIVDGLLHERRYLKDEIIFDEGEEGQALYIVLSGRVLICRPG